MKRLIWSIWKFALSVPICALMAGEASAANLLLNGSFEAGLTPWKININNGVGFFTQTNNVAPNAGIAAARLNVSTSLGNIWDISAFQTGLNLIAGQRYNVSFYARAGTSGRQLAVAVQGYSPFTNYYIQTFTLTTTYQRFSFSFTQPVNNSNVGLQFASGAQIGSVYLDLVSLDPVVSSAPILAVSPASLSFGTVTTGQSSAVQTLLFKNNDTANLTLSSVALNGTSYQWGPATATTCQMNIAYAPGASCTMALYFKPLSAGSLSGSLSVANNAGGSPKVIPLSGTGGTIAPTGPVLAVNSSALNFGSINVGQNSSVQTVQFSNTGGSNLVLSSVALNGAPNFQWGPVTPTTCQMNVSYAPGGSCTMALYFKPQSAGSLAGSLSVVHNASGSPKVISLAGTGVAVTSGPLGGYITNFSNQQYSTFYIDGAPYSNHQPATRPYAVNKIDDYTLRFEVRPGDSLWCCNSDASVVQRVNMWNPNTPISIEFKFMMEPGPVSTASWFLVSEMHNDDTNFRGGTSPPVAIGIGGPASNPGAGGDYLQVIYRYIQPGATYSHSTVPTIFPWVSTSPIVRGRWYTIKIQTNIVQSSAGYLKVWVDGAQVVNYNGLLGYGAKTYWMIDLYRATSPQTVAAQYRNITIAPK